MPVMKQGGESPLIFVLKGLIPYTQANLLLSFKPSAFFYELEKRSGHTRSSIQSAYWRAQRSGLITNDTIPRLTARGQQKLQPYIAQHLTGSAQLLVVFDIPESTALARRRFRLLLRRLHFNQVQKSVWITDFDHRSVLGEAIRELQLEECVKTYEAIEI